MNLFSISIILSFLDKASCSPSWSPAFCIAEAGLELLNLLLNLSLLRLQTCADMPSSISKVLLEQGYIGFLASCLCYGHEIVLLKDRLVQKAWSI